MDSETNSSATSTSEGSQSLRHLLQSLRTRIRGYVIVEGLAIVVVWLTAIYLLAIAVDYLPVLVGLTELPRVIRIAFLAALILGSIFLFIKLIVARLGVPISDRSLALLIERYHGDFNEALVTTVELDGKAESEVSQQLYEEATENAVESLPTVDLSKVFNRPRILSRLAIAVALVAVLVSIAIWKPAAFALGAERLLMLRDKPWPRQSQIEVVGVRVIQENPNPALEDLNMVLEFSDRTTKAAKGANLVLLVRAKGPSKDRPKLKIPNRCIIYYRTADGERGYQYMDRVGAVNDGIQAFEFAGQPFRGLTGDLGFDVRGDDHRLNGFTIDIVDSPVVVAAKADCEFPDYMVDEDAGAWTPRTLDLESGLRLPFGSKVGLRLESNKPLRRAVVFDPATNEARTLDNLGGATEVQFDVEELAENVLLEVTLEDTDGILNEAPFRAEVLAYADEPPKISSQLVGIGDAITPEARVPLQGSIEDDFGIAKAWIDVELSTGDPREEPIRLDRGDELDTAIDFRDKRQDRENGFQLSTEDGSKLKLSISAEDRYDLGDGANVGRSEPFELEIVTPSQLLRRLERREASQRRLLEQIYLELTDAHNLLVRVRGETTNASDFAEPGDEDPRPVPAGNLSDLADAEVKLVFSQRSWLQLQKSRQEIRAIADTFDHIRLQLINNRVESEDRKERIRERIIEPLNQLLESRFSTADEKVLAVQRLIEERLKTTGDVGDEQVQEVTNIALEEMQLLLVDLDNVLQEMLKFESYNELLDVVREMIRNQEAIIEATEKERKRQAFEDILK